MPYPVCYLSGKIKFFFLLSALMVLSACGEAANDASSSSSQKDVKNIDDNRVADRIREGALGDMTLGDPDSPVTLIEYASFTCGGCANFHLTSYPTIKEKYISTNKVNFVFREFPTGPQQLSYIGSVIARCAADIGGDDAFFAVGDALLRGQRQWVLGSDPRGELLKIANQAGLDSAGMDQCLKRQEIVDVINQNVKEAGTLYNVGSTPSFILNGKKLNIKNYNELDEAIAEAIANAGD